MSAQAEQGRPEHEMKGEKSLLVRPAAPSVALFVIFLISLMTLYALRQNDALPHWLVGLVKNDTFGLVTVQLAGFIAFLFGCGGQALAVMQERAALDGKGGYPRIVTAGGLSLRWERYLRSYRRQPTDATNLNLVVAQHHADRLTPLRLLQAAFPTTGFIGTVLGVKQAIVPMGTLNTNDSQALREALKQVVAGLEFAFNTTLVGLVLFLAGSFILGALSTTISQTHTRILQK